MSGHLGLDGYRHAIKVSRMARRGREEQTLEDDEAPVLLERVGALDDVAPAHQRAGQPLEPPAIECLAEQLPAQPPAGLPVALAERREQPVHRRALVGGGRAEEQRHTPVWSAHVALPAHPPVVFLIAEVRDEVHHPAAAARRIARDQIQLLALVLSLRQVRPLPVRSCAGRVFGRVRPRGRFPGSSFRCWRAGPYGSRCGYPACRCPCRRRSWPRPPRSGPAGTQTARRRAARRTCRRDTRPRGTPRRSAAPDPRSAGGSERRRSPAGGPDWPAAARPPPPAPPA